MALAATLPDQLAPNEHVFSDHFLQGFKWTQVRRKESTVAHLQIQPQMLLKGGMGVG